MRARAVRFRSDASWYPDFEDELLQFPRGNHDDQVDALAWLGLGLAKMVVPLTEDEEEEEELFTARRENMSFGRSVVTGY